MAKNSVLVVGSLNMDEVVQVPRLPAVGETLLGAGSLRLIPGGKGANQAVALARLGATVTMAGRVGTDPFGEQLLRALQADQINTDLVVVDQQAASGVAFIFLTQADNAIVVASGANAQVGKDQAQLARIVETLNQVDALVMQLEIPSDTVCRLIDEADKAGVLTVLNLAPAQQLPQDSLRKASVLVVNESEASLISGQRVENVEDARIVGTVLHEHGIATVVITLGALGALLVTNDEKGQTQSFYQAAPKLTVVDTTAAGDCFVGALTVALIEHKTPQEALRFAVYASALKVTRFGAQTGLPTRTEVMDLYNKNG
ncbi:MAG TPA: ribokinase [Ktedonobacteraceae bacterium]|nr:ribokinase [Ktedonobacteraceae bacterium]